MVRPRVDGGGSEKTATLRGKKRNWALIGWSSGRGVFSFYRPPRRRAFVFSSRKNSPLIPFGSILCENEKMYHFVYFPVIFTLRRHVGGDASALAGVLRNIFPSFFLDSRHTRPHVTCWLISHHTRDDTRLSLLAACGLQRPIRLRVSIVARSWQGISSGFGCEIS